MIRKRAAGHGRGFGTVAFRDKMRLSRLWGLRCGGREIPQEEGNDRRIEGAVPIAGNHMTGAADGCRQCVAICGGDAFVVKIRHLFRRRRGRRVSKFFRLLLDDLVPNRVEHAECKRKTRAENPAEIPHQ
jgi:hypothetical protein